MPGTSGSTFLAGSSGGELTKGNNGGGCGAYIGIGACNQTQKIVEQVVPVAGLLEHLYVQMSGPSGAGKHVHWAVIVHNSGTALGCDIDGAATSCHDTVDAFPVHPGDTVVLEATETTLGGIDGASLSWAVKVS